MNGLITGFAGLGTRKQAVLVLAVVAVAAALAALARGVSSPSMTLLYAGLEPAAAGEVLRSLDQSGVAYEVRGGAIFVPGPERDTLRLALAAEGIPANGASGYELLDTLTGFGTTAQMFDAAYWRAKEGELARTLRASPHIRSARVHISNVAARGFARPAPTSASVSVTPAAASLGSAQARAVRHLVASAVAGLDAERVTVVDGATGLVVPADDAASAGHGAAAARAAELRRNVERLLEARVGAGRAIVEVNLDLRTEYEEISERRFDPEGRVAISTDTEERSNTASTTGSGAVTVASNLPDGEAGAAGSANNSQNAQTRERVNFEVSETRRDLVRGPGEIRRLTVAVLVDGVLTPDDTGGTTWQPRAEAELVALRELVASAVGYDEARGDTITVRTMEFERQVAPEVEQAGTPGFQSLGLDPMRVLQLAVLAIVSLVLGLFVVRPVLLSARSPAAALPPPAATLPSATLPSAGPGELAIADAALPELPPLATGGDPLIGAAPDLPQLAAEPDDAAARLKRLVEDRREESSEVLRTWLGRREEAA